MLEILDVRIKSHQLMEVMLNKDPSIYFCFNLGAKARCEDAPKMYLGSPSVSLMIFVQLICSFSIRAQWCNAAWKLGSFWLVFQAAANLLRYLSVTACTNKIERWEDLKLIQKFPTRWSLGRESRHYSLWGLTFTFPGTLEGFVLLLQQKTVLWILKILAGKNWCI